MAAPPAFGLDRGNFEFSPGLAWSGSIESGPLDASFNQPGGGFPCRGGSTGCFQLVTYNGGEAVEDFFGFIQQPVTVPASQGAGIYTLTFYAKQNFGAANTQILGFITVPNPAGGAAVTVLQAPCTVPVTQPASGSEWTQCVASWSAPFNVAQHNVYIAFGGDYVPTPDGTGKFLAIDDVSYTFEASEQSEPTTTVTETQSLTETKVLPPASTVTEVQTITKQSPENAVSTVFEKSGTAVVQSSVTSTLPDSTATVTSTPVPATSTVVVSTTITGAPRTATVTQVRPTTVAGGCVQLQAVFPAACCPTGVAPLRRVTKRNLHAFGMHGINNVHKRALTTLTVPVVASTETQQEPNPTVSLEQTVFTTATITETKYGGPETTTTQLVTVNTVPGGQAVTTVTLAQATNTVTSTSTSTVFSTVTTVTATAFATQTACSISTKYTATTCASGLGGLLQGATGGVLAILNTLRLGSSQPVLVKCGTDLYTLT